MKTAEHIIETVDKLVRKYHTRDPYELCQLLGIKIHYYDLQKKLKGFFYYQSRQKNIVIDHNVNGILERILLCCKKEPHSSSLCTVNGLLFHYINQAPLFLSSLAGQSRHQSTFLRLSMLLHYTFSVLQQSHYQ